MIKIKILLVTLLLSFCVGCAASPKSENYHKAETQAEMLNKDMPIRLPNGGTMIPKSGNTVFTMCGLPIMLVIHNELGVEVYGGEEMVKRAQDIDPDHPLTIAEISKTWGDHMVQCPAGSDGTNAPVKKKPREWYAGF